MKSIHFGSAMIDIITLVAPENIERATFSNDEKSFLMLETGRKLPAESITTHVGGGACNTGVSLARRGWDAAVQAKVGDDLNASAIRAHLTENGLIDQMVVSELATGTAVMVASHDRNASIFVHRGANEVLTEDDLPVFAGVDLAYIAPLSSGSADCFPAIVARAKAAGAMVASNPGIRQLSSRTEAFLGSLEHLDLLSVNRIEADALVPVLTARAGSRRLPEGPPLAQRGLVFGAAQIGLKNFLHCLQDAGPKWVMITDGTEGAYLACPGGDVLWHPTVPAKVAGTAGAGDAFCSTLTAALAEGIAPDQAMTEASVNAASVVSFVDTTQGLLARDDISSRAAALGTAPAQQL